MGLTMHQRHVFMRELSSRFQRSSKKQRSALLTQCVELTGYNRAYAAYVLRNCGRKQIRMVRGRRGRSSSGWRRTVRSCAIRRGTWYRVRPKSWGG